mmetsp:Transcript_29251/g.70567  ORF Transcript_29251/g.70567 Transcript_29251/m.70567 type:complete len:421 (+) Transcript_29251:1451-2713(+)
MRLPPESRVRLRGHTRQPRGPAFLQRQRVEPRNEPHRRELRVPGGLRRSGHVLPGGGGVPPRDEAHAPPEGVPAAGESRDARRQRLGGALRRQVVHLPVPGALRGRPGIQGVGDDQFHLRSNAPVGRDRSGHLLRPRGHPPPGLRREGGGGQDKGHPQRVEGRGHQPPLRARGRRLSAGGVGLHLVRPRVGGSGKSQRGQEDGIRRQPSRRGGHLLRAQGRDELFGAAGILVHYARARGPCGGSRRVQGSEGLHSILHLQRSQPGEQCHGGVHPHRLRKDAGHQPQSGIPQSVRAPTRLRQPRHAQRGRDQRTRPARPDRGGSFRGGRRRRGRIRGGGVGGVRRGRSRDEPRGDDGRLLRGRRRGVRAGRTSQVLRRSGQDDVQSAGELPRQSRPLRCGGLGHAGEEDRFFGSRHGTQEE